MATPKPGLTLIEVLLAIVIASVGATVVLQALGGITRALTTAEQRFAAYTLAASKIAEFTLAPRERTGESRTAGGTLRVGDQPYGWQAVATPLNAEHSLEAQTLTVAWSRGRQSSTWQMTTLRYLPEPREE